MPFYLHRKCERMEVRYCLATTRITNFIACHQGLDKYRLTIQRMQSGMRNLQLQASSRQHYTFRFESMAWKRHLSFGFLHFYSKHNNYTVEIECYAQKIKYFTFLISVDIRHHFAIHRNGTLQRNKFEHESFDEIVKFCNLRFND